MRVLIDASVLLRFALPSPNPARAVDLIVLAALAGLFDLLLPRELLIEVTDKLATSAYLAARVSPRAVDTLIGLFDVVAVPLAPYAAPFPATTRDPRDDYLIAYALRDQAEFLVTGDRDLLALAPELARPRIVDPGAFVRLLRDRGLVAP